MAIRYGRGGKTATRTPGRSGHTATRRCGRGGHTRILEGVAEK